jgi:hypothetical protein
MNKARSIINSFNKLLPSTEKTEKPGIVLSLALVFLISFIYFCLFGKGTFFFQENKSLFIFSGEYLQKFIVKPGGPIEYAGNFLTQFYHNTLGGSLINSAILILIFIVFMKISRRLSAGSFSLILILLPVCFLLFIQIRYVHSIHNSLGYLLLALYFLTTISSEGKRSHLIILSLFPVFYYITGSFALIYPVMFLIYSIIYENKIYRYLFPALLFAIALGTFLVFKDIIFLQTGGQLVRYPLPFIELSKLPAIYNVLCGYFILFPLLVKLAIPLNIIKYKGFINLATLLMLLPITIFLLAKNYNHNIAVLFEIEKSVFKRDWDAVIKKQEKSLSTNSNSQYYYNLALSEKGLLCSRMFFSPQNFGAKSLILQRDLETTNRGFYFYYTIGLISEAHHLAYESMVVNGYRPENTKMLIKTELINGNYKIAERYINILKKTLYYRSWAKKYEKMLFNPELVNSDPELGEKIRLLPQIDFFIRPNDIQNIELVLMANPNNKRAFEYKLARMLLEKDIQAVVNEVKKMKGMGYTLLPRHIEEAILVFVYTTRQFPDLGGLSVSPASEMRFDEYLKVYNLNIRNKQILEKEIKKVGEKTFWYYYQFK